MKLRQHQQELKDLLDDQVNPKNVLMHVVPGGGKSLLPGLLLERYPNHKIAWFVPRLSLRRQAALGLKRAFNLDVHEFEGEVNPSRGTRGFVATHQSLPNNLRLFNHEFARHPYIVVVDELHHAKTGWDGMTPNATAKALGDLQETPLMLMTGTLDTSDNQRVYGIPYRYSAGVGHVIDPYSFNGSVIRYTRQQALGERAIVPIQFEYHDGKVGWEDQREDPVIKLSEAKKKDAGAALFTALSTAFARDLFENAYAKWRADGDKFLVVLSSQKEAKVYYDLLLRRNVRVGLAIQDHGKDAHKDIEAFRRGDLQALVTVAMAYEGLDVPEITHLACLTRIRSVPWIEQMFARAWRTAPGKQVAHAFIPSDVLMMEVVDRIRAEQEAVVRDSLEGPDGPRGPKDHEPIIPRFGSVEEIRQAVLDGKLSESEGHAELRRMIVDHWGFDPAWPESVAMVENFTKALARKSGLVQPRIEIKTHAEESAELRQRIAELCRDADAAHFKKLGKDVEFGYHQRMLMRFTKQSITEMNREELKHAFFYAVNHFRTAG